MAFHSFYSQLQNSSYAPDTLSSVSGTKWQAVDLTMLSPADYNSPGDVGAAWYSERSRTVGVKGRMSATKGVENPTGK